MRTFTLRARSATIATRAQCECSISVVQTCSIGSSSSRSSISSWRERDIDRARGAAH